jgi:hypothetical protein
MPVLKKAKAKVKEKAASYKAKRTAKKADRKEDRAARVTARGDKRSNRKLAKAEKLTSKAGGIKAKSTAKAEKISPTKVAKRVAKPVAKPVSRAKKLTVAKTIKKVNTKRGTGNTYKSAWEANKGGVQKKYKSYDAFRKAAVAYNSKKDSKGVMKSDKNKTAKGPKKKDGSY